MIASTKKIIKDLKLPTTGTYYNYKIGDTIYGKKIVAWWKPSRALLENGHIYFINKGKLPK